MRVGRTYRHCCMTEVDFHVLKIFILHDRVKLKGWWVSRHGKETLWGPDRIEVPRDQVRKWTELSQITNRD